MADSRTEDEASDAAPPTSHLTGVPTIRIAGGVVHTVSHAEAIDVIVAAAHDHGGRALAVASINLDHVHHFSRPAPPVGDAEPEWFNLIDGAPIARQARRMTGDDHPRLAGSDLIEDILGRAAAEGLSVGFLGGSAEITGALAARIARDWPGLRFRGQWTPDRAALADARLAEKIRGAAVDILVVCLGKPRQEEWISRFAEASGARVLLAFGAVVDFLAGRISRAPRWVVHAGFEWAWRLMLEPRRLAKRYLVQGPPAYLAVRRSRGRSS